jgi:tetratricopeptide (TPR) repeat protein
MSPSEIGFFPLQGWYLLEISLQPNMLWIILGAGGLVLLAAILLSVPRRSVSMTSEITPNAEPLSPTMEFRELIRQGNALLSAYQYDEALEAFQTALKLRPKEPSVHFKIGRLFLQKGDYKNAHTAFRNTLNLNPEAIEAYYEMARIAQATQKLDQAYQALDKALSISPDHEECLKLKAKLFEQEGRYEEAQPLFRKLAVISDTPMKYRAALAEIAMKLDQSDNAIAEYERLMRDDPENATRYQERVGQVYFEKEEYEQAVEAFKLALLPRPNEPPPSAEETQNIQDRMAAALCNRGVAKFESGAYLDAIECYEDALQYDKGNADIHYNLGKAYARTNNKDGALKYFQSAIALSPADASSYYEIAVLQDECGLTDEAISSYEQLLKLNPRHAQAHFGLGTLYGVQNQLDQCIRHLSAAITLNPNFVEAMYNLGVALEEKQDFKQAVQTYKKVLQLEPAHEKAKSNLAHIQHSQKKK